MAGNGKPPARKTHPMLPPSLNRARGSITEEELEERRLLALLEQAIRKLHLKKGVGDEEITTAARWLYSADVEVKYAFEPTRKRALRWGWKRPRGRQVSKRADYVTTIAAHIYQELTDAPATRKIDWDSLKPYGELHDFLMRVFHILGIKSSSDTANRRLQEILKEIQAKLSDAS